jgi:hypothetical protein
MCRNAAHGGKSSLQGKMFHIPLLLLRRTNGDAFAGAR